MAAVGRWSGIVPAVILFFLAPLVAEFLLGDFPIIWLPLALVMAPMYGGGAILVREFALRFNAGWPGILALGAAFGTIEEAYTTQSLFNPNYLGLHLLAYGWIPSLGIAVPWTVFVIGIHTIWSIATSIGLAEAITPRRASAPWLGPIGLAIVAIIFTGGCILLTRVQLGRDPFVASATQFASAAVAAALLVAFAWWLGRVRPPADRPGAAPAPLMVCFLVLGATSLFMVDSRLGAHMPPWLNVVIAVALLGATGALLWRWSMLSGWRPTHGLAALAGAVLTYVWWGFYQTPVVPTPPAIDLASNAIFAGGALFLLGLAYRRVA